jgi:uncharacterized protein (DUF1501 family)
MTFKLPVLSRRQTLQGLGGFLLADFLLPRVARASNIDAKRKFVFAYFEGGWDLLLGLDPRDPATNTPAVQQIDPGYAQLGYAYSARGVQSAAGLKFGPAVPPSFLSVAPECSIINGITMDTASHDVARRYFITGQFPRGLEAVGSSAGAEILSQIGESSAIAHMAAGTESYAVGKPAFCTALNVNSLNDLAIALTPIATIDPKIKAALEAFQDQGAGCVGTQLNRDGLTTRLLDSVQRSRAYIKAQLSSVFDLTRMDAEMQALIQLYDIAAAQGDTSAPEVMAFAAGQAIKKGVSQCVSFQAARTLDTHSNWAQDQAPRQEQGWKVLGALIADLKNTPGAVAGQTMLDETTILAFSEFGRTPLFNNIRGRDHFLGNSALVAGGGLKHGLTVGGGASVGMMPVSTDLMTGQAYEQPTPMQLASGSVLTLTPKHVLATVMASAGLDYSYLRVDPIKALLP